jgi:hypothetical protein
MQITVFPALTSAAVLSLRSRGSADWQTMQAQPITGTPWEVPVPNNVIFTD